MRITYIKTGKRMKDKNQLEQNENGANIGEKIKQSLNKMKKLKMEGVNTIQDRKSEDVSRMSKKREDANRIPKKMEKDVNEIPKKIMEDVDRILKEKVNRTPKKRMERKNKEERGVNRITKEMMEDTNKTSKKRIERENKEEKGKAVRTILKKNQIVIVTLALMLITAGYMNYNNSVKDLNISLAELGDAKLVSTNVYENDVAGEAKDANSVNEIEKVSNEINDSNSNGNEVKETSGNQENQGNTVIDSNTVSTSSTNDNIVSETGNKTTKSDDYFTQTRLDREAMYSQMLETYQKILENEKVPADQKSIASNEIKNINDRKNAIAIAENLIKTKGFEDVAILLNDNSINVVVKQPNNLQEVQVAQITNIVSRELKAEISDIHISVHK